MEAMEANASRQSLGLSVIIITKNEASRLGECLASVQFADEIIVLDGCSTDATVEALRPQLGAPAAGGLAVRLVRHRRRSGQSACTWRSSPPSRRLARVRPAKKPCLGVGHPALGAFNRC